MVNPPFKSDLFYSVQNEDYQTELAVLNHIYQGTPLRVLLVTSSGENALSLLTQATVTSVVAAYLNAAPGLEPLRSVSAIYNQNIFC